MVAWRAVSRSRVATEGAGPSSAATTTAFKRCRRTRDALGAASNANVANVAASTLGTPAAVPTAHRAHVVREARQPGHAVGHYPQRTTCDAGRLPSRSNYWCVAVVSAVADAIVAVTAS